MRAFSSDMQLAATCKAATKKMFCQFVVWGVNAHITLAECWRNFILQMNAKKMPPVSNRRHLWLRSFYNRNPQFSISLLALVSSIPMCYNKFGRFGQLIS